MRFEITQDEAETIFETMATANPEGPRVPVVPPPEAARRFAHDGDKSVYRNADVGEFMLMQVDDTAKIAYFKHHLSRNYLGMYLAGSGRPAGKTFVPHDPGRPFFEGTFPASL